MATAQKDTASKAPKKENAFTRKIGPLPMWAWLGIVAGLVLLLVVYEYRKQSSQGSNTPVGNTTPPPIDQFYINTPPTQPGGGHGHHHHRHKGGGGGGGDTKEITVTKDETLGQLASYLHWSKGTLAAVEEMNAIGGKELTSSSMLHKGQTIIRPVK